MNTVNYLLLFIGRSDKGGHEATVHSFEGLLAARRAMMESYWRIATALNVPASPTDPGNPYTSMTENNIRLERNSDTFQWEIIKAVPEDSKTDSISSSDRPYRRQKYTVLIEEHIVQEFPMQASDISHALQSAEEAYKQGELVVQPSAPITRLIMARNNKTGETTEWKEF